MARLSGRAPYCGSLPSRPMSARAAGVSSSMQVVVGEPRREVGHEQVDDASERLVVERVEDDDLVDAVEELRPERGPQRIRIMLAPLRRSRRSRRPRSCEPTLLVMISDGVLEARPCGPGRR